MNKQIIVIVCLIIMANVILVLAVELHELKLDHDALVSELRDMEWRLGLENNPQF